VCADSIWMPLVRGAAAAPPRLEPRRPPLAPAQQTCPRCGGRGQNFTPCDKCGGDGRVRQSKKIALTVPAGAWLAGGLLTAAAVCSRLRGQRRGSRQCQASFTGAALRARCRADAAGPSRQLRGSGDRQPTSPPPCRPRLPQAWTRAAGCASAARAARVCVGGRRATSMFSSTPRCGRGAGPHCRVTGRQVAGAAAC
jgi:hypothetical protein